MSAPQRRGQLRLALHSASTRLPGPHRRPAQETGIAEATALLESADEHDLVVEVLEELLRSGTADEARLAATLAYEAHYGTEALIEGWERADLPDRERQILASRIGVRIVGGECPYHPALRGAEPVDVFLAAFILFDHAWFLDSLPEIFTDDPREAALRFWYGLVHLTEAEADAVLAEIAAKGALSDAHLQGFWKHVNASKANRAFDKRPGGVRWRA